MADQNKPKPTKVPFNPGLVVAMILMIFAAFHCLVIGSVVLTRANDSLIALAIGIDLPIIAIAMLIVSILIIMRKKLTLVAVTGTMILTIALSFVTAGIGSFETISENPTMQNDGEYEQCIRSWESELVYTDNEDAGAIIKSTTYTRSHYVYIYDDSRTLDSYSDVIEECETVAAEPLNASGIATIIVQSIILALIPSFAAIFVWLYFKQSDRSHAVLVR